MAEETLHPFEADKRQRAFILRVTRIIFLLLILVVALLTILQEQAKPPRDDQTIDLGIQWYIPMGAALCMFLIAFLVDLYTPNKKIPTISGVLLGILAGMLATVAVGFMLDLLVQTWVYNEKALDLLKPLMGTIKVMLGLCLCYLGVITVLQTQDDFRLVIPYVEFAKSIRGVRPLILDTSVLIDGRIIDIVRANLLQTPLIVPRFVIGELQLLADSSDKLKRGRGRRGLDVLARLQRESGADLTIDDSKVTALAVDQMVVELGERLRARVMTTDLGLARVAEIRGLTVLNLHEIAHALRPALIPGEQIMLQLVKPGEQPGQAVGYLDDGTMVVVDNASHRIGNESTLLVTGAMQTSAGRLVFAKLFDVSGEELLAANGAADFGADSQEDAGEHAEDATDGPTTGPSDAASSTPSSPAAPAQRGGGPARPGPFPPKPFGGRREGTARNPRR